MGPRKWPEHLLLLIGRDGRPPIVNTRLGTVGCPLHADRDRFVCRSILHCVRSQVPQGSSEVLGAPEAHDVLVGLQREALPESGDELLEDFACDVTEVALVDPKGKPFISAESV